MLPNTRSQDFRYIFTNAFSVTVGTTEAQLTLGIQKNPGTADTTMEEQVGIMLTPSAAKLLAQIITLMVDAQEDAAGSPIPVDVSKLDALKAAINTAKAARLAKAQTPPKS